MVGGSRGALWASISGGGCVTHQSNATGKTAFSNTAVTYCDSDILTLRPMKECSAYSKGPRPWFVRRPMLLCLGLPRATCLDHPTVTLRFPKRILSRVSPLYITQVDFLTCGLGDISLYTGISSQWLTPTTLSHLGSPCFPTRSIRTTQAAGLWSWA